MQVTVESRPPQVVATDLLVLPLLQLDPQRWRLPPRVAAVDQATGGRIAAVVGSGDFQAREGQSQLIYPDKGLPARRLLLLGLGAENTINADTLRSAAGRAVGAAAALKALKVAFVVPNLRRLRAPAAAQSLAEGAVLAGYRFDTYRSNESSAGAENAPEDRPGEVAAFVLCLERSTDVRAARANSKTGVTLAESQNVARDLSNEPGNALPPAELARAAQKVAREVGLRAQVLGVPELTKRKMGAILAVGQGSINPPRLIVLEHDRAAGRTGGRKKTGGRRRPTVCLVGKGITFDSGGISIKPSPAMDEMKHDMSGAAAVVGALRACAVLQLPVHVVGVIAAAENLPSGTAYRPGDVVTAASGKTIEILNTDAEGRVVLADALHYARTEYEPQAIIDLATLTGACVVALGRWATGMFGNNERLVERIRRAGDATGERAWPMPLLDDHRRQIRSQIADIKNTGGREAGSSTAAAFLSHFVGDTPWVHLDIAGTAWTQKSGPYQPRGATGVGVRMLLELLRGWKDVKLV